MDTALITFMLHTTPHTSSVHLIGSWDNFTKHYPMERDIRRARGQWRGCYAFEDIICDGYRGSTRRTGGLKMGSTYYYYYKLDDGTEFHDASVASTTTCPYLPGQPVNLLCVPTEIQPLRYRSASMSSMANEDIKTMNPKDKFVNPRPPPQAPSSTRLNTATSVLTKKRSTRSLSPKSERLPWSPRMLFGGLRSPHPVPEENRGRSSSLSKASLKENASVGSAILSVKQFELRSTHSVPHTRSNSPQSVKLHQSHSPPLLQQEEAPYSPTSFVIPDIAEEAEDDDNFASLLNRLSLTEKGINTPLAPPPFGRRSPARAQTGAMNTAKPLPQLPEEMHVLSPIRLRSAVSAAELPKSHFSVSTTLSSPTESHFSFPNAKDGVLDDVEDLTADIGSGDESTYSPMLAESPSRGFNGYSLPEEEYCSAQTLKTQPPMLTFTQTAGRTVFDPAYSTIAGSEEESISALEQLMSEMGYLGEVILGK